jgi:hypothetical protein
VQNALSARSSYRLNDATLRRKHARLRVPEPSLESQLDALRHGLDAMRSPNRPVEASDRWTWREWLWPSPLVWALFLVTWAITFGKVGLPILRSSPPQLGQNIPAPGEGWGSLSRGATVLNRAPHFPIEPYSRPLPR